VSTPTPEEFRAVGFTAAAAEFPLSNSAAEIVAIHNGVARIAMPPAFFYAPNAYMRDWLEALGERLARGETVRDPDGRWHTPDRLRKLAA
jgi:hypothetical protein